MPEFENANSQPNPNHQYSPSTDASKKSGGRRRSGGFKTEIASSAPNVGEVDPIEALKSEKLSGSTCSQEPVEQSKHEHKRSDKKPASENSVTAKIPNDSDKVLSNSTSSSPQPSEATLASIQSVEAKIARRRDEREKKRSLRNTGSEAKPNNRSTGTNLKSNRTSGSKGGLLASIAQFFNSLFGNASSPADKSGRNRKSRKSAVSKNHGGKNQRSNSRSRQKNYAQSRSGKKRQHNGPRRTTKSLQNES